MAKYKSDASLYLVLGAYGLFTLVGGGLWALACAHHWMPWWTMWWWGTGPAAFLALVLYLICTSTTRRNR